MTHLIALPRHAEHAPPKGGFRRLLMGGMKVVSIGVGGLLLLGGAVLAPLPGPLGMPLTVAGLILVLKNSYRAKRLFIRAQRWRPNWVFPVRRLLRKEPEVAPVFWQQALRIERLILRESRGFLRRGRLALKRRFGRDKAASDTATASA
ncbi:MULTISPECIES: hypothetical protein [Brevundimonas]|uniref:hypothetical protein n=1 Tax=Brevundimonas TaxID=41275 RepID=UPI0013CE54B9|nr:hypothetical protein [Brevundimonas lutea]